MQNDLGEIPVVFFVFNRPDLTARVFEAIRAHKPKILFVFSDGPREGHPQDRKLIAFVRGEVIPDWECDFRLIAQPENLGLRQSVLKGLDQVFSEFESAIILEDDMLPVPSFFDFQESLLRKYKRNEQISAVSGVSPNRLGDHTLSTSHYFFSRRVRVGAFGTWSRVWGNFRANEPSNLHSFRVKLRESQRLPGLVTKAIYFRMILNLESLSTWAIPFGVFSRRTNSLCVTPTFSLVESLGEGERATHTRRKTAQSLVQPIDLLRVEELLHPMEIAEFKHYDRREGVRMLRFHLADALKNFLGKLR